MFVVKISPVVSRSRLRKLVYMLLELYYVVFLLNVGVLGSTWLPLDGILCLCETPEWWIRASSDARVSG